MTNKQQTALENILSPVEQNLLVSLSLLYPHSRNFREHPPEQIKKLKASLERWGQVRSIVAKVNSDGTYTIVAGHGIVQAAQALVDANASYYERFGKLRVDVIPSSWSEAQITGYLVADNVLSNDATDDEALLAELLKEQQNAGYDLASLGSDDESLRQMLESLGDEYLGDGGQDGDGGDEFDITPEEGPTRTHVGELWQLGKHRLLVGDCTKRENVKRLMQGELASAVVTDSPYGIDREGITNDGEAGLRGLLDGAIACLPIKNGVVVNFQSTRLFPTWLDAIRKGGYKFERMLWMYKPPDMTFPWRGWILKSEAILVSSIGKPDWNEVHPFAHDCYVVNKVNGEVLAEGDWHPSIKPLAVMTDIVERVCSPDSIVYEPFCGSGTTLIACERAHRQCFGIEIEPNYADVILRRYEAETGQQATLLERVEEVAHA